MNRTRTEYAVEWRRAGDGWQVEQYFYDPEEAEKFAENVHANNPLEFVRVVERIEFTTLLLAPVEDD